MLETQDSLIGGHPILDFINTVEDQDKSRLVSHIHNWQSFLNWVELSYLFNAQQKASLHKYDQAESNVALAKLHATRETLYAMFKDLVSKSTPHKIPKPIEIGI